MKGGRSKVVGVETHLDDAKLQQFVNSKTQPPVDFAYFPFRTEGVEVGIIEIPVQKRPIYLKKTFGKLGKDIVYIRRGSSTMTVEPEEIAQMGIESARLVLSVTPQIASKSVDSNEPLQKQDFKSSFFELLKMHSENVNSIVIRRGIDGEYFGRECFSYLLKEFKSIYVSRRNDEPSGGVLEGALKGAREGELDVTEELRQLIYEKISERYEEFFTAYQKYIGHYFRQLHNIFKFVDQHDFFEGEEFKEKKSYTDHIRAQLSSDELGLLFYHSLSDQGNKFKDLVEKYALLEDMHFETLINKEHKNLYAPSAYGESG